MSDVTVLTITKRTGWEETALKTLENQTYQDFRWVVVSEEPLSVPYIQAPPKTKVSNLNASHNEGLRRIETEYVLFYQDFIELAPDTIERLLTAAKETDGFVTTTPYNSDGSLDMRHTGYNDYRECEPKEWEINVAIAPMKALREIGGFDEELDNGWSWDNVNVAERAALLGYTFYIDEGCHPQLLFHPKEPDVHPELVLNGEKHEQIMRDIRAGLHPIKCDYLL